MSFEPLDTVVLLTDRPEHGLRAGDVGTIVDLPSPNEFEVEFVTASGATRAVVTLERAELRAANETDLLSVRSIARSA